MKLNLGSGGHHKEGYDSVDMNEGCGAKYVMDVMDLKFEDESIDEILAYHILEHFYHVDALKAIEEWYRVLKKGAVMYLIVPNIALMAKKLANHDIELSGFSWGALGFDNETASTLDQHKYLYDLPRLLAVLNTQPWSSCDSVYHMECPQVTNADWQLAVKCIR